MSGNPQDPDAPPNQPWNPSAPTEWDQQRNQDWTQPNQPGASDQGPPNAGPGMPPPDQPTAGYYTGPTQPTYPTAPPPSKRGQYIRYGILAIIAIAVIGGFFLFRDRLSNDVTSLAAGECFDQPDETTVTDVQRQPCNEAHDAEVIINVNHTAASGATYPGASEFADLAQDECTPAYEAYTGLSIAQIFAAGFDYNYFYPTSSGWGDGDRVVTCFAVKGDQSKMTTSVRNMGTGASPAPTQ